MTPTHPLRAVIFDCDGVMFDSRQANINFYNHLREHFHMSPMDPEEIDYVHMATARESVAFIFRNTDYFEAADAYRLQMDYNPFIKDMVIAPGLRNLLIKLRPSFGLAVATNRSNTIQEVLRQNRLDGLFHMVVSSLDVQNPKPHPESIYKILRFFDISEKEAVYIGDSQVDQETAEASGVCFVAYGNETLKADVHVKDMIELEKAISNYKKFSVFS